ncbi:uncharacterized protein LOC141719179 [Apium graveolens]|uniref:uncharacterized protein LOC141719179 n=1 Tax=Apium graveolens TaxID=4045 RepID=UPI003D79FC52
MVINETKWDEEILTDLFNDRDVQLIKNIPLSAVGRNDSWMWFLDEKGQFTVKSCYCKLIGEYSTSDVGFWKKVWLVWEAVGLKEWSQVLPGEQAMDNFKQIFSAGTKEQSILVAVLCWSLWNRRNKWVWDKIDMSVFGTKAAALNLLADWRKARMEGNKYKPVVSSRSRQWKKPQAGWVKINVNAVIFTATKSIGIGGVIRDENGEFLRAMCKQETGMWQVREAEAISLREVMSWTKRHGFSKCEFETDSKLLADAFNGGQGNSYFYSIVNECIELSKHFQHVLVQFVHRSANVVAHSLARVSHSESGLLKWVNVAPDFLIDVLTYDSI